MLHLYYFGKRHIFQTYSYKSKVIAVGMPLNTLWETNMQSCNLAFFPPKVEESKVVRVQLELAQVKADIDRRIHEKEEEFEITRLIW